MTKNEFHGHCAKHEGGSNPGLHVEIGHEYRGFNKLVLLHGVWANCAILDIELYRPMPAHQHEDYAKRDRLLERERIKYARWLAEWLKINGYKKRTVSA